MNAPSTPDRSLLRLLAAMLLPVLGFALVVGLPLPEDGEVRAALDERAAWYAAGIAERVQVAEAALGVMASAQSGRGGIHAGAADVAPPFFLNVSRLNPEQSEPPASALSAKPALDRSAARIELARSDSGQRNIFMVRRAPEDAADQRPILATLNPDYLWGTRGKTLRGALVLAADGTLLHGSSALHSEVVRHFDPSRALAVAGEFVWTDGSGRHLASHRPIRIAQRYALPDWTLVMVRPAPDSPLSESIGTAALAALGLALIGALWVGRAGRWPRGPAANAAQPPISAALAADATMFAALAEIDRAILSRAAPDRILETAIGQVSALLGCDFAAVSSLESDAPTRTRTLRSTHKGMIAPSRDELPRRVAMALAGQADGCWTDDPTPYPFLASPSAAGASRFLLLPIYRDGHLAAVLSLGWAHPPAREQTLAYAQAFASRIGVALTAATRSEEARYLQRFDSMTGLPNRRHFRERLSQEISRAGREKRRLALLYTDLDQFKRVNDGAGHEVGDTVLREAAARLKDNLREEDVLAHFGGDEFVLMVPGISDAADAGRVAGKLIDILAQPFPADGVEHRLSASIGIGLFPDDGRTADTLLQSADAAMSRAKRTGGGQYAFFEGRINAELKEQFALESELRRALAQEEFLLVYQPQVDARSGRLVAAEALVRWRHPRRGLLAPAAFIEAAEKCGLIVQIGEYTRRLACAQFRSWKDKGIDIERVSVNVSGTELDCDDFMAQLEAALAATGVPPSALEVEITERTLVRDSHPVARSLQALRALGIRTAIDDFGTGSSSLGYLKRVPFDLLKIDRSFIADIGSDADVESRAVTTAVIGIARSLGKQACAEGVETEAQRTYLTEQGCDMIQGYLVSRPLPPGEFEEFARHRVCTPEAPGARPGPGPRAMAA